MRHLVRNSIIVLVAIVVSLWAIYPPKEKLRLGKDLAGGVSLVYAVNVGGGDVSATMGQVIEVLKERLDPSGVLEISIVRQGTDRLEITMPLPSAHVKELKATFDAELNRLAEMSLGADQIDRVMALPADQREQRIMSVAGDNGEMAAMLADAAALYDTWQSREAEYRNKSAEFDEIQQTINSLRAEGEEDAALEGLTSALAVVQDEMRSAAREVARARLEYQRARSGLLTSSIDASAVRRALNLSNEPIRLENAETGEYESLPSPRQRALQAIEEQITGEAMREQYKKVMAAWDNYESQRRTLDDVEDLKRLVQSSGVLNFRITVNPGEYADELRLRNELRERGPRNAVSDEVAWFRINDITSEVDTVQQLAALEADPAGYLRSRGYVGEEYNGEYYILAWDTRDRRLTEADGVWSVTSAFQTFDEVGRQAIGFNMDTRGGQLLGRLTENNINRRMAVLLDDEVYTAPNIQGAISRTGRITGQFSTEELNYVIRVLNAGSLQGSLSPQPIAENTLAPTLGQDNLNQGIVAGIVALVAVSTFMLLYYFFGGFVAVIGLVINALLILGAMALNRAAFTMPGIAGIILTFGMAVDANVLIYERIREELLAKTDIRTAVRLGYQRALSSIVDGNVTNLIVCVVLGFVGTPEIKGFAITLGIGVVTTLFTALFVSRLIFSFLVDEAGVKSRWPGMQLPLAVRALDRLFTPTIDWLRLRGIFLPLSAFLVVGSFAVVVYQGEKMLGTEFRGGSEITISLKQNPADPNEQLTMERPEVQERVEAIGDAAGQTDLLRRLVEAEVLAVNPEADGFTASEFKIRTTITDTDELLSALTTAFQDVVDARPPLAFEGLEDDAVSAVAVPVTARNLRDVEGLSDAPDEDVSEFLGGVAIVLREIHAAGDPNSRPSVDTLQDRLTLVRSRPEFADTLTRQQRLVVLDGSDDNVRSAVLLVHDDRFGYFDDFDHARWQNEVQRTEWALVKDALSTTTTLASVQSFSPAIAQTFVAQAVIAIVLSILGIIIYVWVRFGSIRYSFAVILPTLHDVIIVVGLIGAAELLYEHVPGLASALMIQPFKIDLNMVAALLAILGYSVNDTIVTMDRVRENRGKLTYASRDVVNLSINQTFSRTIITSGTTMIATVSLYILGGESVRQFAYALLAGLVIGTYSSIAIVAPLVWSRKADKTSRDPFADVGAPGEPM